ncbi:MAG: hypothetical protein AB8F95_16495 [Bacteroidia bacterium]
MNVFYRWTTILATLFSLCLASQVHASAALVYTPEMKAQQLDAALTKAADRNGDGVLSVKEEARKTRLKNRLAKLSEKIEARRAKRAAKGKATNMDSNLRLGLILVAGGLALYILAAIIGVGTLGVGLGISGLLWLIGSLAIIAGGVFLILYLIETAG